MIAIDACLSRGRIQTRVSRDVRPVARFDDRRQVVGSTIAVDDEARPRCEDRRDGEFNGKPAREVGGADVEGDVPPEVVGGEAEAIQFCRNRGGRVVADQQCSRGCTGDIEHFYSGS